VLDDDVVPRGAGLGQGVTFIGVSFLSWSVPRPGSVLLL
jgi:hypothetical protein